MHNIAEHSTKPVTPWSASSTRRAMWLTYLLAFGTIAALGGAIIFGAIPNPVKGGLACLLMLVLLLLKMPVAAAMGVSGALGIYALGGPIAMSNTFANLPYGATASFTLSVLPMFVFMGIMLWRSKITAELYEAAKQWVGWAPAGLASTTTIAGAGLASVSGSTIGITYALGRIGIPEMLRAGYDKRLALGSVMVAGTIGQLIPPSMYAVVYAGFAELPVGPQLLAGLLPGLLLTAVYVALGMLYVTIRPSLIQKTPENTVASTWSGRFHSLAKVWPLPLLLLVVVGTIYLGWATATEAGALGAIGAVLIAAIRLPLGEFAAGVWAALRDTVASVAAILFLLVGAAFLNRLLALSGASRWFADQIEGAGLSRLSLILVLVVVYLLLGMFMEPLSMMLLTVPIFLPVAMAAGIDPMWFGVFFILLAEVAILTPPVGILVFVTHRLAQSREVRGDTKITLGDAFQGALAFIPGVFIVVAIITAWPEIVTLVPEMGAAK